MPEAEPTGQRGRNGRGIPFRRRRGDTLFLNTMIIAVSCSVLLVGQCCVASSLEICSWRRTRCTVTTAPNKSKINRPPVHGQYRPIPGWVTVFGM